VRTRRRQELLGAGDPQAVRCEASSPGACPDANSQPGGVQRYNPRTTTIRGRSR